MKNKKKLYLAEKLKLDDKKIKEHISSWSYETRDQEGNNIVKKNQGIVFWITGLPGSGKSSISKNIFTRSKPITFGHLI